jgi:hypothetical protein
MKLRAFLAAFLAIFTLAACSDSPLPVEPGATDAALSAAELTPTQEISPTSHSVFHNIPIIGRDAAGNQIFTGTFTVRRFVQDNGQLFAQGTLTGQLNVGGIIRNISRTILIPIRWPPPQAGCTILELQLGPLDLNLLGLHVHLDQVNLLIEAHPGQGLLGDLLCAIANILNPTQQLVNLLNQLLRLV